MGVPLSDNYPNWLKEWSKLGDRPRETKYYNQLYISRPKWANTKEIRKIYNQCKKLRKQGINVEVDHIVPLLNPYVCGLNWEGNLQIIPAKRNNFKSNHIWPDSWHEVIELHLTSEPHQLKLDI